jgi:hypothetical protein
VITGGALALAAGALTLGIAYQGERAADNDVVVAGGGTSVTSATATAPGDGAEAGVAAATSAVNPIEGFLPRSGEASACQEPVGVDLIEGYAATLTINGTVIPPEQMNVNLSADGEPNEVITASRSLGHYTYGPEEDCPNGAVLRPTNNVMQVCVYRLEDGPDSCTVTERVFDTL